MSISPISIPDTILNSIKPKGPHRPCSENTDFCTWCWESSQTDNSWCSRTKNHLRTQDFAGSAWSFGTHCWKFSESALTYGLQITATIPCFVHCLSFYSASFGKTWSASQQDNTKIKASQSHLGLTANESLILITLPGRLCLRLSRIYFWKTKNIQYTRTLVVNKVNAKYYIKIPEGMTAHWLLVTHFNLHKMRLWYYTTQIPGYQKGHSAVKTVSCQPSRPASPLSRSGQQCKVPVRTKHRQNNTSRVYFQTILQSILSTRRHNCKHFWLQNLQTTGRNTLCVLCQLMGPSESRPHTNTVKGSVIAALSKTFWVPIRMPHVWYHAMQTLQVQ